MEIGGNQYILRSHFLLGGLYYDVLIFKLITWYNGLIVYILYMF